MAKSGRLSTHRLGYGRLGRTGPTMDTHERDLCSGWYCRSGATAAAEYFDLGSTAATKHFTPFTTKRDGRKRRGTDGSGTWRWNYNTNVSTAAHIFGNAIQTDRAISMGATKTTRQSTGGRKTADVATPSFGTIQIAATTLSVKRTKWSKALVQTITQSQWVLFGRLI